MAKNKHAVELGRKGGSVKGPQKRRSKAHYQMMAAKSAEARRKK